MTLRSLAWLNAITHAAGLVLAATVMRGGYLELVPEQGIAWKLAWAWWAFAALVLVAFMAKLARTRTGYAALALCVVALLVDLVCDYVWIFRYPETARGHRLAVVGGAVVANGLYALGVLVMGIALRRHRLLTAPVPVFGLLFSLSAFFELRLPMMVFSGLTITAYAVWALAVAYR